MSSCQYQGCATVLRFTMPDVTPFDTILQISGGSCLPRCLHVVANLGVADALTDSPRTAAELAADTGADPDALSRVLRLLAAHGVFELRDGKFAHSPASRLLRSDHPQSMRPLAQMLGMARIWATFENLDYSVRTGRPAAEKAMPGGFWRYLSEHPEQGRMFDAAMSAKGQGQAAGVIGSYDFSGFKMIGDIAGGRGHLLQAVLASAPKAKGILFDLPHVIKAAASIASDRLKLQAGDFFKDALPACDCYLVMEIIHDWADPESIAILSAIRRAAQANATLLLIEVMVPEDPGPHWSKMLDVLMLTLLGGRQRTRREYESLFARSGFRLQREIATASNVSILEAVAI